MKERARFLTTLYVRRCLTDHSKWELTQALVYISEVAKLTIIVPNGFVTDFGSVPRLPFAYLLFANLAHEAAVVHDYLYDCGMVSRKVADAIFDEAMGVIDAGDLEEAKKRGANRVQMLAGSTLKPVKRFFMWLGVRIGGGMHYKEPEA